VQPQQLPVLFKSSLTAQLVVALLTAALTSLAARSAPEEEAAAAQEQLGVAHAMGLLEGLPLVPRFDMMAMCLSRQDKAGLAQLWDKAAAAGDAAAGQRLAAVRPKYRL
jgi:hypothetical protein